MKTCSKCKEIKPRNSFHVDIGRVDGLKSHCKECHSNYYHSKKLVNNPRVTPLKAPTQLRELPCPFSAGLVSPDVVPGGAAFDGYARQQDFNCGF